MEEKEGTFFSTEEVRELDLSKLKEKISAIPWFKFFTNASLYLHHIQLNSVTELEQLFNVIQQGHDFFFKKFSKIREKTLPQSAEWSAHMISVSQFAEPSSSKHMQEGQALRSVEEFSTAAASDSSPCQHVASSDSHSFKSAFSAYKKKHSSDIGHSSSNNWRGDQSRMSGLKTHMVGTPSPSPSTPVRGQALRSVEEFSTAAASDSSPCQHVAFSDSHSFKSASSSYKKKHYSGISHSSSNNWRGDQSRMSGLKTHMVVIPSPSPSTPVRGQALRSVEEFSTAAASDSSPFQHVASSDSHSFKSASSAYKKKHSTDIGHSSSNNWRGDQSRMSGLRTHMVGTQSPPPSTPVKYTDRHLYNRASLSSHTYESQDTDASSSKHHQGAQTGRSVQKISAVVPSAPPPGKHVTSTYRHSYKSVSSASNRYRPPYTGTPSSNYRREGQKCSENTTAVTPVPPPRRHVRSNDHHSYNTSSVHNMYKSRYTNLSSSKYQRRCRARRNRQARRKFTY